MQQIAFKSARRITSTLFWLGACATAHGAQPTSGPSTEFVSAPATMTKIVTRDVTPGVDPKSFAGQPRTLFRAGTYYLRIEEASDDANHIHGLIISNCRESWMVNLFDHTGQHIHDNGPTFDTHAPIVQENDAPAEVKTLEFGTEPEFFKSHPKLCQGETTQGAEKLLKYVLKSGKTETTFFCRKDTCVPIEYQISINGVVSTVIKYDSFDANMKFDPSLFVPPAGVAMVEAKP